MSLVNSKKLGGVRTDHERLLREEIIHRWTNVGAKYNNDNEVIAEGDDYLKGLKGQVRNNVAILMENQAKQFINETTNSGSSGSYEVVAFPMIRRIFSKLLANDIVSVQALTQPTGTMFFFYPVISERTERTETLADGSVVTKSVHTSNGADSYARCLGANCPTATFENCKSLYDQFYDDNMYDHSKGAYTIIAATGSPMTFDENGCEIAATTLALSQDGSIREAMFGVVGFDGVPTNTARVNGSRGLEMDTEEFLTSLTVVNIGADIIDPLGNIIYKTGDEVKFRLPAMRYGQQLVSRNYKDLCSGNGTLLIELDLRHPVKGCDTCSTADGYIGAASGFTLTDTQFAFAWRRYDDLECEDEMGEVSFELRKETVSVVKRQLRAKWCPELAQDVMAYHSIDAEAELTALLSEQIAMEIDREILRDLKIGAAWQARWDYNGWKQTGAQKYTQKEWNQTLITKINQVSAQINKATLRGGANFLVVSAEASAIFDDLENFMVSAADVTTDKYNLGMRRIGTVSGRYTVYVDPYSRANDVLVGHKGTSLLNTGYIYSPYIAASLTPLLIDPQNFANVKGIMTRYAKKMVNSRFYGRIFIDNIVTFDTRELR
jgi:hypothetical protein